MLLALSLSNMRRNDEDDQLALKTLVEQIERLDPIKSMRDRDSEAKSRTLLKAVSAEIWHIHADAKFLYSYNFAAVIDALHSSTRAVQMHEDLFPSPSSPTLFMNHIVNGN